MGFLSIKHSVNRNCEVKAGYAFERILLPGSSVKTNRLAVAIEKKLRTFQISQAVFAPLDVGEFAP